MEIFIRTILESQGNKEDKDDKFNHVDIMCEDKKGNEFIVEIQFYAEDDYFHRILYGASKVITEYMLEGDEYAKVKKVYSIHILYFDLGYGSDYIYHGKTTFTGLHQNDTLELSALQQKKFGKRYPDDVYPEFFLIKLGNFHDIIVTEMDQWVYFFKHSKLPPGYSAKGLKAVSKKLKIDNMTATERMEYEQYLKNSLISKSMLETAMYEGIEKGIENGIENGIEKGIEKGREEGIEKGIRIRTIEIILALFDDGIGTRQIAKVVKLSEDEICGILKENGRI
jgi:hypothetical protein